MIVPTARGAVLEIGAGSGRNLPFYDPARVTQLWALEPNGAMRCLAPDQHSASGLQVDWLDAPAEDIPLPRDSVDTVVATYTLCSIDAPAVAIAEIRRILRPGGRLLFSEHGASPEPQVRRWQDRLNGLNCRFCLGCNINRRPDRAIGNAGFRSDRLDTGYPEGVPKLSG